MSVERQVAKRAERVGVVLCVWLMWPGVLAAQEEGSSEPEPMTQEARDAAFQAEVDRANAAYGEGDLVAAAEAFERAYTLKPNPNILYNIGRIYEKQGNFELASAYYERFVNEPDIKLEARQDALARVKALREVLALRKKPGQEDVKPQETVEETPLVATTDPPDPEPDPQPGPESSPEVPRKSRALPVALLVTGGASLAASGALGLVTQQAATDAAEAETLNELRAANRRGRATALGADVALVVGSALVVTGITTLILRSRRDPEERDPRAVQLAPVIAPERAGAMITFSF